MLKQKCWIAFLSSLLIFTIFFHKQTLGLNLFIYEMILLVFFYATKRFKKCSRYFIIIVTGVVLSAIATIVTHSIFSYVLNFISVFLLIGAIVYPNAKSLIGLAAQSFYNSLQSQLKGLTSIFERSNQGNPQAAKSRNFLIFIVPILIILLFIFLYSLSNATFGDAVNNIIRYLYENLSAIFIHLDLSIMLTIFLGWIVNNFFFRSTKNERFTTIDQQRKTVLKEGQHEGKETLNKNKREKKSGVFLLICLNVLILILNVLDVQLVWINFEWDGSSLKSFVHEGTYILIFSILISIFIVLYYFRGNMNFYKGNKTLKILSYVWLAQNIFLLVSVGIRNFRYIHHYALAYKRIGVIIFLVLTLIGIVTVLIKVKMKKNTFYLFKKNSLAMYIILLLCSLINWDGVIAKHNFQHYNRSFLHLDFMARLSDKTLPTLNRPISELDKIVELNTANFPTEYNGNSAQTYSNFITSRKKEFIKEWKEKNFLEWNYAEYKAYKQLKK